MNPMNPMKPAVSDPSDAIDASGFRIGIVESCYHQEICGELRKGAAEAYFAASGDADGLVHAFAPGAFELVAVSLEMAQRTDIDAVVALGCVLTGETNHDRYLCDAVAHGLTEITIRTGKAVAFGVLTCLTIEQARARAGGSKGNKGSDAMNAAIAATRSMQMIRAGRIDAVGAER